jgi:ATP-dependent Clp protease ATP-binding subunit ClpA
VLAVAVYARDAALRLGSDTVSSEHLWLGIVHEESKLVAKIKETRGVDLAALVDEVERECTTGPPLILDVGEMPYSDHGKNALLDALGESARLEDVETRPAHVLLAILRQDFAGNIARNVSLNAGLTADNLVMAIRHTI